MRANEALERVKGSFNSYPLDCLAIAGAVAAMEDDAWFEETRQVTKSAPLLVAHVPPALARDWLFQVQRGQN
jgi:hypothetical protein